MNKEDTISFVSIVIATYGRPEKLQECLSSIDKSSYPRIQTIVVEDPSEHSAIEQLGAKFPSVKFIKNEKRCYISGSRNTGALCADGEYIFFLDDDNVIDEDCVSYLVSTFRKLQNVGFVGPLAFYRSNPSVLWSGGVRLGRFSRRHKNIKHISANDDPYDVEIIPNAYMTKKETLTKIGLFDKTNFFIQEEEHDLQYRALKAGYKVLINPKAKVWHNYQFTQIRISPTIIQEIWRSRILFERKHFGRASMIFLTFIILLYYPYYSITILLHGDKTFRKIDSLHALVKGTVSGLFSSLQPDHHT